MLNKGFEARESVVPLTRDVIEIVLHFFNRVGIERETVLPAGAHAAHNTCVLQDAQMLRDRLASDP